MKKQNNALGLTLRGNQDDVLATVRTSVLVAKTLQTAFQLDVEGTDCFKAHFGGAASEQLLLGLLDSAKRQLGHLSAASGPEFAMEFRLLSNRSGFALVVHSADSVRCKGECARLGAKSTPHNAREEFSREDVGPAAGEIGRSV
jgi:hypothetical protein